MVFAPLEGWRHVKVTDRHTAIDCAHTLRDLSDVHFADAAKIVLVQDNLNTHKPASLYEAFPAERAVANPPRKIVMQRAARRKVFWNRPPLADGGCTSRRS
jgi:hypothetical protein